MAFLAIGDNRLMVSTWDRPLTCRTCGRPGVYFIADKNTAGTRCEDCLGKHIRTLRPHNETVKVLDIAGKERKPCQG